MLFNNMVRQRTKRILMVDSESSKFMDEAGHIFELHKMQYSNEIEQKTKEITVDVFILLPDANIDGFRMLLIDPFLEHQGM